MRDREKIDLIRHYGKLVELPEGFLLKDCSHSTCDEVHIQVKDGEEYITVWKDRIWHGNYGFNDKSDYWFFDTKKGYEFLNPKIEEIFMNLREAKLATETTKREAEAQKLAEEYQREQDRIERIKKQYGEL